MNKRKSKALLTLLLVISMFLTTAIYGAPVSADEGSPFAKGSSLSDALYVPDRIVVKFKEGLSPASLVQVHAQLNAVVEKEIPQLGVQVLRVPTGEVEVKIAAYKADPRVEYAEPDYIARPAHEPNDPSYGDGTQWGLQKILASQAWDLSKGNSNVVIAVVDWGVDLDHPDLASEMWTKPGEIPDNGTDDDGNGYVDDVYGWDFANDDNDPQDDYYHGTHVAGIAAAATDNGVGVAGVGFNSRIMAVKVGDGTTGQAAYSDIAHGIIYAADNGAKVINLSLGGYAFSSYLESAVNYAWNAGCVLVGAVGNDNSSSSFYPSAYANVIGVSATDQNDARWSSSNYGSYISVAAPGVSIYSTCWLNDDPAYAYWTLSGTSMAAPHVAGLAALLFAHGSGSNAAVRSLIEGSADDLGDAGWDQYYGYGRVNAFQALGGSAEPTSTPTVEEPTSTPMATATPEPTVTPTATATEEPTAAPAATATPEPTATPTPEAQGAGYVQRVDAGGGGYAAPQGAYSWASGTYEPPTDSGVDWVSGADETPIDAAADWVSGTSEESAKSRPDSADWVHGEVGEGQAAEVSTGDVVANPASAGANWDPDQAYDGSWGYTGGTAKSNTNAVSGTTEDQLYQEYREDPVEYRYTLPNGDYEVTLRFAEFVVNKATDRQMRITIEGIVVEDTLSIYALVGKNAALDRVYQVIVSDGELNVLFAKNGGKKKPVISAIAVLEVGGGGPPEPTPTPTEEPATPTPVPPSPTPTAESGGEVEFELTFGRYNQIALPLTTADISDAEDLASYITANTDATVLQVLKWDASLGSKGA